MTKFYSRYKALLFSLILLIGTIGAGYGFARIYYPPVASIGTGDITGTMILDHDVTGDDISTSTSLTIAGLTVTNATATDLTVNGGNITTSKLTVSGTSTLATTTATKLTVNSATIGSLSGVLKATAGVVSGSATMDDIADGVTYVRSHNDFTDTYKSYLNQSVTTAASPSFAGLTINGDGSISGTLDVSGTTTLATTSASKITVSGEADITSLKTATTTQGAIYYVDSTGHAAALGPGTSGQYLKTQGAGANPVWGTTGAISYIKGSGTGTNYQGTATAAEDVDATNLSKDLSNLTVGDIVQITYDFNFERYLNNFNVYTRIQDITNNITLAQFTANAGGWFHEMGVINYIVPSTSLTIRLQAWISEENEDWVVENGSGGGSGVTPVITFQKL